MLKRASRQRHTIPVVTRTSSLQKKICLRVRYKLTVLVGDFVEVLEAVDAPLVPEAAKSNLM